MGAAEGYRLVPTRISRDGGIHPLLERRPGKSGLIILEINGERLTSEIRYEEGEPGEMFPHIYGPVNVDAVTSVTVLP